MTVNEAIKRMTEELESAAAELGSLGVETKIETEYMNAFFKTETSPERARYITLSLVISAEGIENGDEYCLSLGAEIKRRSIDEERLALDLEKYRKMVDETAVRLKASSDVAEEIRALAKEASEEYAQLVKKIQDGQKKQSIYSFLALILVAVGVVILFLVSIFA